jgi:hypothetical protein
VEWLAGAAVWLAAAAAVFAAVSAWRLRRMLDVSERHAAALQARVDLLLAMLDASDDPDRA